MTAENPNELLENHHTSLTAQPQTRTTGSPDGGVTNNMNDRLGPGGPFGPDGLQRTHDALGPAFFIERLVLPVICLIVVVLLAFLLYRLLSKSPGGWSGHNTAALRELEMRYARGEISREEFLQRRYDLASPALPSSATNLPPPSQASSPPPPPATSPPPPPQAPTQTPG